MTDTTIPTVSRDPPSISRSIAAPAVRRVAEVLLAGRFLLIAGLLLAVALVYWPSARALAGLWSDTDAHTYTHGPVILAASLWLIVSSSARLAQAPVRSDLRALAALVLLSAIWLVFWKAGLQDLHLMLLPPIAFMAILAVLGWRAARLCLFPVAYLYFALPFWGQMNGFLQNLTVKVMGILIWLIGLPAYTTGNLVHVPAGVFEIAHGCSGLHYLIVGLALAALYGELMEHSIAKRLAGLGLMTAVAVGANWVRVFTIIVAGYATDMKTFLVTVDHYWFGWGVFAVAIALFFWIAARMDRPTRVAVAREPAALPSRAPGLAVSPSIYAAALACMGVLPALVHGLDRSTSPASSALSIAWPQSQAGWRGPLPAESSSWAPEFHGASSVGKRMYVDAEGGEIELFTALYATQQQGAELVAYNNSILGGDEERSALGVIDERVVHSASGPWQELLVTDASGAKSIIWSHYHIGLHIFVRPLASQLWYGLTALAAQPLSSLDALRVPCMDDCEGARARAATFASSVFGGPRQNAGSAGQ